MREQACEYCKKIYKPRNKGSHFCSSPCLSRGLFLRPGRREKARAYMLEMRSRPEVQAKLHAHLHSKNNPFNNPEIKMKATEALREKTGFKHLNGGNGAPIPKPQKILANSLGLRNGWKLELAVPTKVTSKNGYPTNYKLDIGHPVFMIGIEVDGESHKTKRIQEKDRKKQTFLEERGWTIFRFSNSQVMENLQECLVPLKSAISKRSREIILQMDS
jgi:hypothetical protein